MDSKKVGVILDRLVGEGVSVARAKKGTSILVERADCAQFVSACRTVIRSAFGEGSSLDKAISGLGDFGLLATAEDAFGIIQAARDAWAGGYVFDVKALARADVEADLLEQASALLASGYDRAGTAVAGAVLEERLRSVAPSWGVAIQDANSGKLLTMEPLNVELKKSGAYDAIMQKRITLLGGLRNEAAHGNPFEKRFDVVRKMIEDVVDICVKVNVK